MKNEQTEGPKESIGREAAVRMYNSNWWEGLGHREIAGFQLFVGELCCPFGVFHEAVEESLGRPVFTHEFGLNYDGLVKEFLGGKETPSLSDVMGLIPKDKTVMVLTNEDPTTN